LKILRKLKGYNKESNSTDDENIDLTKEEWSRNMKKCNENLKKFDDELKDKHDITTKEGLKKTFKEMKNNNMDIPIDVESLTDDQLQKLAAFAD
jgi:glucan phosphorylase